MRMLFGSLLLALLLLGGDPGSEGITAQAGHDEGVVPLVRATKACLSEANVAQIIVGSQTLNGATQMFNTLLSLGQCKAFPPNMFPFWLDRIVQDALRWGDGDPMYILKGHDRRGRTVYTWGPQTEIEGLLRIQRDRIAQEV